VTKSFYCWDCERLLDKNQVRITSEEYVCVLCGGSAVDPIPFVSPSVIEKAAEKR
jgi:hypothetical protein